ncbi:hypothetical protein ACFL6R_07865, partial [Gemmatimonadota bacterium]
MKEFRPAHIYRRHVFRRLFYITLAALIPGMLSACVVEPVSGPFSTGGHLVSGGVGPDGIRALNNPSRIAGAEMPASLLDPSELIEGVVIDGQAMAF